LDFLKFYTKLIIFNIDLPAIKKPDEKNIGLNKMEIF